MAETTWRVWWRYSDNPWEASPASMEYTEAEARFNAKQRHKANPFLWTLVLPEGEEPPADKPFRPGPPEIIGL